MHQIALAERLIEDKRTLSDAGFSIYVPKNIGEVPALMADTGRPAESAMLSLSTNDFTTASGIFLFLQKEGQTVAGIRTKMIDLQDETFESHQRRTLKQWYATDGDELIAVAPALNNLIFGKHVYVGELEFKEDERGKLPIASALVRIAVALSFLKWPDVTCAYCILPERHRRVHNDYGFCHFTRNAFRWRNSNPPGGRLSDWGVAVSSRDDVFYDCEHGYWGSVPHEPK